MDKLTKMCIRDSFIEVIGINTLVSISSKLLLIGLVFLIMGQNPLSETLSFLEEGLKKGLSFFPQEGGGIDAVSYTHLDVYKRQAVVCIAVRSLTVFPLDVPPKKKLYALPNRLCFGLSLALNKRENTLI